MVYHAISGNVEPALGTEVPDESLDIRVELDGPLGVLHVASGTFEQLELAEGHLLPTVLTCSWDVTHGSRVLTLMLRVYSP
jgi:hypothetical protein